MVSVKGVVDGVLAIFCSFVEVVSKAVPDSFDDEENDAVWLKPP